MKLQSPCWKQNALRKMHDLFNGNGVQDLIENRGYLNICLNIRLIMAAKTITIREDIYNMLLSLKGGNESFSNFFERLVKSRSNIDKLKELRGTVEFNNKEALYKELSTKRKEIRY